MIGPRNTVVRTLLGETVSLEEWLTDQSEFVDSDSFTHMKWHERPSEFWVDKLYEGVYDEQLAD